MLCGLFVAVLATPIQADERAWISLARQAVTAEVRGTALPRATTTHPAQAVFVTIERNNRVLGCRGSLVPRKPSLEEEIVWAARAAASHDPRYRPLSVADLKSFLVTVTVVERQEPIAGVESLRPEDGLVLKSGSRTGVVLPWEGKDPHIRLAWAYRKAGLARNAACSLFRLIASRYRG